jgi:hypothetical protein
VNESRNVNNDNGQTVTMTDNKTLTKVIPRGDTLTFNLESRGHQKCVTRDVEIATTNITLTGQKSKGLTYR